MKHSHIEEKDLHKDKKRAYYMISSAFWFVFGFVFTGILLLAIVLGYFQNTYKDKVYPGIYIDNEYVGNMRKDQVLAMYEEKNEKIAQTKFSFLYKDETVATLSASDVKIGYNAPLLADQAYAVGRSQNVFTNFYLIVNSHFYTFTLPASYTFDGKKVKESLDTLQKEIYREPVDALFTVENNKVVTFRQSLDGKSIDFTKLENTIAELAPKIINDQVATLLSVEVPIKTTTPKITTEKANDLGIVEVIGEGKSFFAGSPANRVHNISLASSRIHGSLIAPGEIFSFNKTIGDISKFSGFKEAYVIKNGRTVLGDGGGVCQVSTTLFRAILNSGLPVIERNAHSYRVAYYEQQSMPGIDATIYTPSVDLRFKNDMKTHILIQSFVDPTNSSLTFTFYGTKDTREVSISTPVITAQISPPPVRYEDDPTLPKGAEKEIEKPAWGGTVFFERTVKKDGKVIIADKYTSRYTPWQQVIARGTKE